MSRRPAAPGPPAWQLQLPIVVVGLAVIGGLVVTAVVAGPAGYRVGLCLIAGALILAALVRTTLPTRRVGLLAVRNRPFDVIALIAVAVGIVVLALSLPPAT